MEKIAKSEAEWKQELTPEQYKILRKKGTEVPFSGEYVHTKDNGMYTCAACGFELFSSKDKFDSGSGWPSFTKPVTDGHIETEDDTSLGMKRSEVLCPRCGSHLGHVFDDGPGPTGQRYCINSACLRLKKEGANGHDGD